jgi:hypothetical protein
MRRVIWLTLLTVACAFAEPALFYSKTFPGSTPAYSEITLAATGVGSYREELTDDQPAKFQLSHGDAKAMFDLADKLEHFRQPLESGLKVAKVGDKVFRWTDGAAKLEQKFNYTLNPDAQALTAWFERITDTERSYWELERTSRFDRLGVNQSLLAIQGLIEKKRIVAGEQFLPLLDKVAKNAGYINMARDRATEIAAAIRDAAGKTEAAQ